MNYFLLQDLESGKVDAIIITPAPKEEIVNLIAKAKETEDYNWEDLINSLPRDTYVVECFSEKNRIYY